MHPRAWVMIPARRITALTCLDRVRAGERTTAGAVRPHPRAGTPTPGTRQRTGAQAARQVLDNARVDDENENRVLLMVALAPPERSRRTATDQEALAIAWSGVADGAVAGMRAVVTLRVEVATAPGGAVVALADGTHARVLTVVAVHASVLTGARTRRRAHLIRTPRHGFHLLPVRDGRNIPGVVRLPITSGDDRHGVGGLSQNRDHQTHPATNRGAASLPSDLPAPHFAATEVVINLSSADNRSTPEES
jgi:hypothetical protein